MGQGAESTPGYDLWFDEDAEDLDELLESLDSGFHTTVTGDKILIKEMGNKHLYHAIQYAKRSLKDYSEDRYYWEHALPLFLKEQQSRLNNKA